MHVRINTEAALKAIMARQAAAVEAAEAEVLRLERMPVSEFCEIHASASPNRYLQAQKVKDQAIARARLRAVWAGQAATRAILAAAS